MRRLLAGPLALGVATAALVSTSGGAGRPLSLTAPARQAKGTVGFKWTSTGARLARLDQRTLRPLAARSPELGYVDAWAFARPDGGLLAVAAHPDSNGTLHDAVRFVQLRNLRLLPRTVPLGGSARALLWARLDRVVAVVGDCCASGISVVALDTGARRVVATTPLPGNVQTLARAGDALVLLEAPLREIGSARLDVVDADGTVRSVRLDRVQAGTSWPYDVETEPVGTIRMPGLAVDPAGYHAYVVQPDGPAADVDLRRMTVSYHDLAAPRSVLDRFSAWLTPTAAAKALNGPERRAHWLGGGLLAVTGTDQSVRTDADGNHVYSGLPSGLAIVDTRDWTIQMLDPGADSVAVTDGFLLATGRTWSSGAQKPTGIGLAAYGPDRKLRFRLFAGAASWVDFVFGRRAYVGPSAEASKLAVVDLATGRVVGKRAASMPTPLLGDSPAW